MITNRQHYRAQQMHLSTRYQHALHCCATQMHLKIISTPDLLRQIKTKTNNIIVITSDIVYINFYLFLLTRISVESGDGGVGVWKILHCVLCRRVDLSTTESLLVFVREEVTATLPGHKTCVIIFYNKLMSTYVS